ncbi:hypothetical protein [Microbacterium sp. P04]|uniref:hypothetical protein n=1 Tax=Microbacterium sp. P04 TaxID=3366947 RepID=UPI0037466B00
MSGADEKLPRTVLPATRIVAVIIIPFLAGAVFLLFGFPRRSGELFAWQIDPPLTAYLLASAYVGGIWFFVRVARERRWHRVRHGFPAVTVFAGALLVSTLTHLDKFSSNIFFFTWLALYATTPFAVALLAWLQRGDDDGLPDPVDTRVPRSLRGGVIVVGTLALLTGAILFVAPQLVIPVWAWTITPLTAQVVGTVLSLTGVVAWGMLRDDRWSAFRILFQSQLISLAAIVASLVVAHGDLLWDRPAAYGFVALVGCAVIGYGALTIAMERRARRGIGR